MLAGSRRRGGTAARSSVETGSTPGDSLPNALDEDVEYVVSNSHSGHAILHDFCMSIPYGLILVVAGIVSFFFKGFGTGLALLGAGVVTEMLASLSLKNWKRHQDSRLFTAGSAGLTLAVTVSLWQRATTGLAAIAAKALSGVSALMLLFLVYNVLAGGNPPKKADESEDLAAGAPEDQTRGVPLSPST